MTDEQKPAEPAPVLAPEVASPGPASKPAPKPDLMKNGRPLIRRNGGVK